jgi:hypothetical protein
MLEWMKATSKLPAAFAAIDAALDRLQNLGVFDVVVRAYATEQATGHSQGRFLAFDHTGTFTHETIFGTLPIMAWGKTAQAAVEDLLARRLDALAKDKAKATKRPTPSPLPKKRRVTKKAS